MSALLYFALLHPGGDGSPPPPRWQDPEGSLVRPDTADAKLADLLAQMLHKKPGNRLSVKGALAHPYVCATGFTPSLNFKKDNPAKVDHVGTDNLVAAATAEGRSTRDARGTRLRARSTASEAEDDARVEPEASKAPPSLLRMSTPAAVWYVGWPTTVIGLMRSFFPLTDTFWVGKLGIVELNALCSNALTLKTLSRLHLRTDPSLKNNKSKFTVA